MTTPTDTSLIQVIVAHGHTVVHGTGTRQKDGHYKQTTYSPGTTIALPADEAKVLLDKGHVLADTPEPSGDVVPSAVTRGPSISSSDGPSVTKVKDRAH